MKSLIIYILASLNFIAFSADKEISLVTEVYPPYVFKENGSIKGVATEIVKAVFKEADISSTINIYPFARAFHNATNIPDTAIFPLIKLTEREPLLIWGSELFPNAYVYTLKSRKDIKLKDIQDLQNYSNGVIRNAADHLYLKELGIKNIQTVITLEQNIKKMMLSRIDTVIIPEVCFNYTIKTMNLNKDDFVKSLKVTGLSTKAYLAFNKKTDKAVIERLNKAFSAIKEKGIYKKIIDKYYE